MGRTYEGSRIVRLTEAQRTLIIAHLLGKSLKVSEADARMTIVTKLRVQSDANRTHHVPHHKRKDR